MTLNYLGKYDNLSLLWEAHPNGGIEGEYCYVGDQLFVWDKYENDWVEGSAEALDVVPSEQPERESNNGLNCIGCFESEQQLWSQHPQGGVEGDYVVIAGKEYIWDKYNKEWREATEEDAAHFTAVIVQDEAYEYSRLAITFMGSFEDVSQIWKVYPQGGIEGGYIYLGEDKYIWDKYSYSWKPFEPTESSKLRPIDVTYTEGVVAYSEDYINYIGTFDNLDQVWEMYPNGGKDGDYILVNGERLKWNKYTSNWGEDESGDTSPARPVATIYGDLHVFNDLVIGEGLYARILEELSKKQWVQDNFTTKQWLLDQNYARQEWVLDQYKVLQDWVDQRNADIAKWILERNYISEGDISSETVMNLIETDEITITKKDGVLVAIASGGQGSVPIITTKDVDAIPSDQNVFSAAKVVATFLDTTKGGTVHESVNFEKGIRIGGKDGIEIIYDIENNALCFGGNAYSLGGMTAGGVGSGGSGGGGISYNRLDSWSDYSADKAGYVLSALLGKDLDNRVSALANAGYITTSALAPYALRSEIPSLEGYATLDALNTLSQTVVNFKSLFDSMFEKDSGGNIHAKLSLWSSGGITAGGVGSGGSGGGGISYNRLDSWSDYSADKAGYVLSALLGKDLDNRVSALANAGYVTQSALAPYALRSEIPSLEGYFLASNFNQANIKSTLGISDWALAEYPTYLIAQGNVMAGEWAEPHGLSVGGWLSNDSGFGYAYGTSLNVTYNMWHHRLAFRTDGLIDHWMGINTNKMSKVGQLAHISDIPTKLSQLTDDVVAGNYLSKNGGTINGSLTATSFIGNLTGNADSATKLATPRTIWGRFFDGTDDVNGTLYGVNFIRNYNANEIIYEDTIDGDVYVGCSSFAKARVLINANGRLVLTESGNVAIGGTTADEKLHVHGNGKFTGNITASTFFGNFEGNINGQTIIKANTNGSDSISSALDALVFATKSDRIYAIGTYYPGISFNHLLSTREGGYKESPQAWIGTRLCSTAGSELSALVFATKEDTANTSRPIERMAIMPNGNVAIGGTSADDKLHVHGNGKFTGALISQALSSAGISIGCDASGVASDNYAREINTFANKLYLQYRGGDLDLCGGGGTTYIGGALDGKTANFTSLTSPAITTNTLTIGGATITYDSVNEALCVNGNMYALGGITAGGAGISAYTSLEARVARLEQRLNIS